MKPNYSGTMIADLTRTVDRVVPPFTAAALEFTVPFLPPSVNHYKLRRYFNSRETQAFIEAVCIFSRKQAVRGEFYTLELTYHIPEREFLRWDTNNFWKVAVDALVTAGVIRDDRYVIKETAAKLAIFGDAREAQTTYRIVGIS